MVGRRVAAKVIGFIRSNRRPRALRKNQHLQRPRRQEDAEADRNVSEKFPPVFGILGP